MPRTVDEIAAEMSKLKAEGKHQASAPMRALREEMKMAQAPAPSEPAVAAVSETMTRGSEEVIQAVPPALAPNPLDSDEWRFIEKTLAEAEVPEGIHQLKKYYQSLQARVRIRRVVRKFILERGPGADWPNFSELGLNPDTGERLDAKPRPAPALAQPPPQVVIPAEVPRAAGIAMSAMAFDPMEQMKAAIMSGVMGDVSGRPEPATRKQPEAAAV